MAQEPISALPPGGPITGTEQVPCVQGGVTVRIPTAVLVGAAGPAGPPGPAGPAGPTGPPYTPALTVVNATYTVLTTDDIVLVDLSPSSGSINLPALATFPQKLLFIKRLDVGSINVFSLTPAAGELIDGSGTPLTLAPAGSVGTNLSAYVLTPSPTSWLLLAVGPP